MTTVDRSTSMSGSLSTGDATTNTSRESEENDEPSFLRDLLRPWLYPRVYSNCTGFVPKFQRACGVFPPSNPKKNEDGQVSAEKDIKELWQDPKAPMGWRIFNFILSILFNFGSLLGNEIIYITFFPFVFWNIDMALGRRLVWMWCMNMYVGQGLKDHLKLPRPAHCSPVVRSLDDHFLLEYGFPSTHTMAIMGQAFLIVFYTWREDYAGKDEYPIWFALSIATIITINTSLSRIYMGVHCVPDIIGGALITMVMLVSFFTFDNYLEAYVLESPTSTYFPMLVMIVLLLLYPRPKIFTPAYGDTAMISAVGNGTIIASFLVTYLNFPRIPLNWLNVPLGWWLFYASLRTIVGFITMVFFRQITKSLCFAVLVPILPKSDVPPTQRYSVVVPTKFITYTVVSFSSIAICPVIFNWLKICSASLDEHVLSLS